ncbi:MAG TPA: hypothetical protein PLT16_07500, partial [Daejeonella sp.]
MINRLFKAFLFLALVMPTVVNAQQKAENLAALNASVEPLMKMSLTDVKNLVPPGSGIFFIGCPNCKGGAQEMGILNWEPGMGDQVKCKFCSMTFPNEKYPHNGEKVIIAPSG